MRYFNTATQFIKNLVAFSHIKSEFNFFLSIFVNWLESITRIRFSLGRLAKFSSVNIIRLVTRTIGITINIVNIVASILKIIFTLFTSVFLR
jgi:hypothetical protein